MPDEAQPTPEPHPPQPLKKIERPAEETTPYELAPEPEAPPPSGKVPGKLGDKSFIDEFPEDADLETDPEVERALKGEPPPPGSADTVDLDGDKPTFVKPGGDAKAVALIGLGVAIGATITAAMRATEHWFYAGALTLYLILLHSILGVAAAAAVAYFEKMRLGRVDLAASRMLVAVSIAHLVISAGKGGYNAITAPLGVVLYLAALAVLFRWAPVRMVRVGALHAVMIAGVYLAMVLYAAASVKTP